jgi:ABC-2 type transport system ATP-binding protein
MDMTAAATNPGLGHTGEGAGVAALEVAGVSRTYPAKRGSPERAALKGVSLGVHTGEWVALLGPNGSGKSTLVRIISGADAPDSGTVRVFGASVLGAERRRALARASIVFQRPGLDEMLTVRENLLAQASLYGLRGAAAEARVREVAAAMSVSDRLNDRVGSLSGGLQRRADLARALLHDPDLLVLDEATAGLDHQSRMSFLDTIASIRASRQRAMTVLMTTHLMDEAERADRVIMMAAGNVVADGAPAELRRSCGGRIVRVRLEDGEAGGAEDVLRRAGLEISATDPRTLEGRTTANGEAVGRIEQAAAELARAGAAFEVAPPNLGDAYLALTGASLQADGAPEPAGRRRRRR